jgi:hypothetical protein
VFLTKYYSDDQIAKNDMGSACSMCERERGEVLIGFWWGNLGERDPLEVPGVDARIILRCIFRKCDRGYGLD